MSRAGRVGFALQMEVGMVCYRCEVVTYGRDDGKGIRLAAYRAAESLQEQSPHALAAYRAGVRVEGAKNGTVHDFRRRHGVRETFIALPPEAPPCYGQRQVLWSFSDQAEGKRKNARIAREVLVELPPELSTEGRSRAVHAIAEHLVERYRLAVDATIHDPPKNGDAGAAHLLCSTRRLGPKGFEGKTTEIDDHKTGRKEVEHIRATVAKILNAEMELERMREILQEMLAATRQPAIVPDRIAAMAARLVGSGAAPEMASRSM